VPPLRDRIHEHDVVRGGLRSRQAGEYLRLRAQARRHADDPQQPAAPKSGRLSWCAYRTPEYERLRDEFYAD
jgi:hypothetical protein